MLNRCISVVILKHEYYKNCPLKLANPSLQGTPCSPTTPVALWPWKQLSISGTHFPHMKG